MKKFTMAAALVFSLGSAGVLAENSTLETMTNESAVIQLSDQDLASVQGGFSWGKRCSHCYNNAYVSQLNLSIASFGVLQSNGSWVQQSNN